VATQKQVAVHLGITPRRVGQMVDEQAIPAPNAKGAYDLDACRLAAFRRLREQAAGRMGRAGETDLISERALLAKRQRERVELDIAIKRNKYVEIDEVCMQLTEENVILRDQFYSLGGVCGPYLVNIPDAHTAQAVVDAKMNQFLQEFQDRIEQLIAQFEAAIDAAPEKDFEEMTEDVVTKHPALVKMEERAEARLRDRMRLAFRAFGPKSNYELEAMILDLRRRVEALEAEREPRRRRP
jgi:hypothetical protein